MAHSPEEFAHQEWLGYVQPVGLVVSVPALLAAQCHINRNIIAEHRRFLEHLPRDARGDVIPEVRDLPAFVCEVLDWEAGDLVSVPRSERLPESLADLEVPLPQYSERLRPTYAVPVFRPEEDQTPWQMLVQELPSGIDFDAPTDVDSARHWNAAPQAKFERLLRESGVPIGLLSNLSQLRLVYAPKGESSGHMTFDVAEMVQVAGRPIFAALHMLLSAERMFSLAADRRLPAILAESRKYQNTVSTQLAEQVLAALYELIRGFQAADEARGGELLDEVLVDDPNHVYAGLLTVLLRLVFVLYAEDRGLLSSDPVYSNFYSVGGLFDRLREESGQHPDTMQQRFGAWAQLVTLFRLVYEGGQHGDFQLPGRKGYLFDPDRYPFLEGRARGCRERAAADIPRVSDGVVFGVLRNLLVLGGERLSYRRLDVEQIGSVYETMMGFDLEVATGRSIAIKPTKPHGAPATIDLEALLTVPAKERAKWLKECTDQKLTGAALKEFKAAKNIDELLTALDKKIQKRVTPRVVPAGAMVLQPSDERRKSGSHYTPRVLTNPIVRTALTPILNRLTDPTAELPSVFEPSPADRKRYTAAELRLRVAASERAVTYATAGREVGTPHPEQILALTVCDPAMGSGAFLVETCRQLGDALIEAWHAHQLIPPDIPVDEDETLHARRLIAQRCLYGVDRNPLAVDLAKLSLWLVTLASDHPFTFLDHSLRHGDSLVGLTRAQIVGFHWDAKQQQMSVLDSAGEIGRRIDRATEARVKILTAREDVPYRDQEDRLAKAEEAISVVRLTGDACVSAFFAGSKKKARNERRDELATDVAEWFRVKNAPGLHHQSLADAVTELTSGPHPVTPFHWEIEFPEVFFRENGGFDCFVGNPPFMGGRKISSNLGDAYRDWLAEMAPDGSKNADLVAHFFRHAYVILRHNGTFGLIATNTICEGDTRATGLRWIRYNRGSIYSAQRRLPWPGQAAVHVSVVHILKGVLPHLPVLDGATVEVITAFLFHRGGDSDPFPLKANSGNCFQGHILHGIGFTFDDTRKDGKTAMLDEMHHLLEENPSNAERIRPYIGGAEINDSPTHEYHRHVICFEQMSRTEAEAWPELMEHLRQWVKPERDTVKRKSHRERWWLFGDYRPGLEQASIGMDQVIVSPRTSKYRSFCFLTPEVICSESVIVIPTDSLATFGVLHSRIHENWSLSFGYSLKDDPVYSVSDCFETFPFPPDWESDATLEAVGERYYEFRAQLMIDNDEGLTQTYNRFHDPDEPSPEIHRLRELHAEMDRAVLEAYGWRDLAESATCEFLLDYEEDDEETGQKRKKKKPWRYRWPDAFRDEVLARLLELNEQRYREERLLGEIPASPAVDETGDTDSGKLF